MLMLVVEKIKVNFELIDFKYQFCRKVCRTELLIRIWNENEGSVASLIADDAVVVFYSQYQISPMIFQKIIWSNGAQNGWNNGGK